LRKTITRSGNINKKVFGKKIEGYLNPLYRGRYSGKPEKGPIYKTITLIWVYRNIIFMFDAKYSRRSLSVLNTDEVILETQSPKIKFTLDLFEEDIKLAQSNNLNISRIIRFKFHEWLQSKVE